MKNKISSLIALFLFPALLLALFLPSSLVAQQITPSVWMSSGNVGTMSNGHQYSWSMGETFTTTLPSSTLTLTQGFQQLFNVLGCTDPTAFNYNANANQDDGTCIPMLTCNITAPTTSLCAGESVTLSMNTTGGGTGLNALPANLQQGLVAYYPFNGNANDESGNGNHGTVNGATLTSDRFGNANGAFHFDIYSSSLIDIPNLASNTDWSISFWCNPTMNNNGTQHYPIGINCQLYWKGIGLSGSSPACGLPVQNVFLFDGSQGCSNWVASNSNYNFNVYNHIGVTKLGTQYQIFVNGILVNTSNSIDDFLIESLTIGRRCNDPLAYTFDGEIDDVILYGRALATEEMQQLYTAQSYNWSNGATSATATVSPNTNTTYSCTVTQGAQTCTASVDVTVNPVVSNTVNASIIQGQSYTLGTQNLTNAGTYTEVFTSASGCDSTVTLNLTVEQLLTCNITAPTTTLCVGENTTISLSGNNGAMDSLTYIGQFNGHYYYLSNSVHNWNYFNDFVQNNFSDANLCIIESLEENLFITSNTNNVYSWIGLFQDLNSPQYSEPLGGWKWVDGNSLSNFSNWGSGEPNNGDGMEHFAHINHPITGPGSWNDGMEIYLLHALIEFNTMPLISTVSWSNGDVGNTTIVSPTTNTTYSCTVTQGTQTCTASVDVTVNPVVSNTVNASIIQGQSYTLGTQNLTTAGTYTEVFTSAAGCDSTVTLNLTVEPLLTCNITAPNTTLCAGESVTLSMNTTGGGTGLNALPANLQQGLVAYYPFNGNANDESGNGNNGTVNGATLSADRFGNANGAYSFDGGNTYITTSDFINFSQDFSINFWVRTTTSSHQVVLNTIPHNVFGYAINPYWGNFGQLGFIYGNGQPAGWIIPAQSFDNPIATLNEWVMHTVTKQNSNLLFYQNDDLIYSNSSAIIPANSLVQLIFGQCDPAACNESFLGNIDDAHIYNRALTPTEIQQLYTAQSFNWSNGATANTTTVSPTTNTTYSCTVTQGAQTCTASLDVTVNPLMTFYADADGDGFGDLNAPQSACVQPAGTVTNNSDCNDNDAALNSISDETCNSFDDNCDGSVDEGVLNTYYLDMDGDGFGVISLPILACSVPLGYSDNIDDCNDYDPLINANGIEICNGADDDCDAQIDEELPVFTWFIDNDGDGIGAGSYAESCAFLPGYATIGGDCNDNDATISPVANEICNNVDENCDGVLNDGLWIAAYIDADGDGYGANNISVDGLCELTAGFVGNNQDCDDSNPAIYHSAVEICDGLDNNCNGQIDDGLNFIIYYNDNDGDGFGAGTPSNLCSNPGAGYVTNDGDCDDANNNIFPEAFEICNILDDDCDAQIDEELPVFTWFIDNDGDGIGTGISTESCAFLPGYATIGGDCNDNDATISPVANEICNNVDENCDGVLNDGLWIAAYIDADGDGYGANNISVDGLCELTAGFVGNNQDCDDNEPLAYTGAIDVCDNGIDEDCSGSDNTCIILGCTDPNACNFDPTANFDNGSCISPQPETCNGLDDDCDDLIDEGLTPIGLNVIPIVTSIYPVCSGNSIKSANLNNGINSEVIDGNGNDLWFSLNAQYNTLRAGLSAATGDNDIRLYQITTNGCLQHIETEHEVTAGNQTLISDQLTSGTTYYIAIHHLSGNMNPSAKICFNHLTGSVCDHYYSNNTGVYTSVCNSFKAQFRSNATAYMFEVLSASQNGSNTNITPWSYTTPTANSVVSRLGAILPANQTGSPIQYVLRVPVVYSMFDAAGNVESILANATSTCNLTLNNQNTIALRLSDRCPATKSLSGTIAPDRTVCGAIRYDWEFTQVLPVESTPQIINGGNYTPVFFLSNVPGIATGKTYIVRVRPVHSSGSVGNWGVSHCLRIGNSGMMMQETIEQSQDVISLFTIYPNPTTTSSFEIQTNWTDEKEENVQVSIQDITGKIVFNQYIVLNNNTSEIEFGNLADGIYMVTIGEERKRLQILKK